MTRNGNPQVLWPSARRELTIVHENEYIACRDRREMGCMRWLVWGFIFEAIFRAAMVLCWWLWLSLG